MDGAAEHEARRARRRVLIVAALVGVLVAGGVASLLARRAPPWGGDEVPAVVLGGAVTEPQMRAAVDEFRGLVEAPPPLRSWGLEGNVTLGSVEQHVRFQWDPSNQAYELAVGPSDEDGTRYERRQRDGIVNYDDGDELYVGRDERPETYAGRERASLLPGVLDVTGFVVEQAQGANVRGRPATHFVGRNASGPIEVWVYDADLRLAGLGATIPAVAYDVRLFYDGAVSVAVATEGPRASVRIERVETVGFTKAQPRTLWINGTVDRNHTEEVRLEDLELRATDGPRGTGQVRFVFPLAERRSPPDHPRYLAEYVDGDGDGLVSPGDRYQLVVRPGTPPAHASFFDRWAATYEGGPVPGAGMVAAALATGLGCAAWRRLAYSWISS